MNITVLWLVQMWFSYYNRLPSGENLPAKTNVSLLTEQGHLNLADFKKLKTLHFFWCWRWSLQCSQWWWKDVVKVELEVVCRIFCLVLQLPKLNFIGIVIGKIKSWRLKRTWEIYSVKKGRGPSMEPWGIPVEQMHGNLVLRKMICVRTSSIPLPGQLEKWKRLSYIYI